MKGDSEVAELAELALILLHIVMNTAGNELARCVCPPERILLAEKPILC